MNAWTVILDIVLILISIVLIIAVLLQQGQRQGLGAISGGAETFFGKNRAKSYEAKMAKVTKIGAAIFIVAAIAATIVASHPATTTADDTTDGTTYTGGGIIRLCTLERLSSGQPLFFERRCVCYARSTNRQAGANVGKFFNAGTTRRQCTDPGHRRKP